MSDVQLGRRDFLKAAALAAIGGFGLLAGRAASDPGGVKGHYKPPPTTTTPGTTSTTGTTTTTPVPTGNPVPPPGSGCYFGAYIEGRQTFHLYDPAGDPWGNAPLVDPGTSDPWPQFEADAGKKVKLLMHGYGILGQPFAAAQVYLDAVVARGAVSCLDTMGSGSATLASINNGDHDAEFSAWFGAAAAWGHPFVIRPWAEMNGGWYSYGQEIRASQGGPAAFVAAWRRIHDLAVAAGASNISWHWCPNVDPERIQTPLESLYPGDAYVDWAGMTGYSHATNELWDWVFGDTYARLVAVAPTKPVMIGELASIAASRQQFLADMFAKLPTSYPAVKAFCWFNWYILESGTYWTWPIEAAQLSQFQAGIGSSYYVGRA